MSESNESSRSLAVGDKLYRVVERIPDGPDVVEEHASWVVQERTVRTVTAKMMSLDRPFSFCAASHGRVAIDRVLGVEMFTSRADAVANFLRQAERIADKARRDLAEANRMVAWAGRTIAEASQRVEGVRREYPVCPKCHCRECADCTCCLEHDERDRDLARAGGVSPATRDNRAVDRAVERSVERSVDRKAELMASIAPVDDEGRP